jgi:hypothetical protein
MDYALSDADMRLLLPGVPISIYYPDVVQATDIQQLLGRDGRGVVLFLTESLTVGHWTGLLRKNTSIEFFDPYGLPPDSQRSWLTAAQKVRLHERLPALKTLLYSSPYTITYNPFHYQTKSTSDNTCGRHTAVRLRHAKLSESQYSDMIHRSGLTADEFVLRETQRVLGR